MLSNGLKDVEVSDLELNVKEKLYAVDAFKLIEENYKDTEIYFIMGADNFTNIRNWKNANEFIEKYQYIILERANIDIESYINEGLKDRVSIVKNENYNTCSSSDFRDMLKQQKRYNKEIIPEEVIDYIIENKLFLDKF